jgi:hypothetical protein
MHLRTGGLLLLLLAGHVIAAEHADEDYYDPTLPKSSSSIPIKPFDGERYEAEIPDTLDLAFHASEAINFLTRCIAPESKDLCIFHLMHGQFNPTIFEIGHGSNQNQNAKWTESVAMMRAMTGSDWNTEGDRNLMSSLVRFTGPDGLFYVPVKDRPWAYIDPGGDKDFSSTAWKDITPKTSSVGNLQPFDIDLGHVGINGLGEGTKMSTVTLRGNTVIAISENILGYPIHKHAKYRNQKAGIKKVGRFATSERFIWH